MSQKVKVEINGKIECTKPFKLDDTLKSIREKLKEKAENAYFLTDEENLVDIEDEEAFTLKDFLVDSKIKLKTKETSKDEIKVKESNNNSIPITNKEERNNQFDFSKYDIIKKEEDFTIYKYSKVQRKEVHKYVYKYNFDNFNINDEKFAYVVLFVGRTGNGKSTALNAFFNIIKGIKLEDNFRFLLIEEEKKKGGQGVSQTDGVHLYYLKDYNNKPVILIDSQGYGDTSGIQRDKEIDNAFAYLFSNIIDHINAVGFISKATDARIDILTKYIFASVTKLFSDDISENFIILATHANRDSITKGPIFVETIVTDAEFLKIKEKGNEKWWYAFDSKLILDNDIDKLTKFSYSQLSDFYNEKVKKLKPKDIKKSAEVLNKRKELTIQVNKLSDTFQKLMVEQKNLTKKEDLIIQNTREIQDLDKDLEKNKEIIKNAKPELKEKLLFELEQKCNNMINKLNNQPQQISKQVLKYWNGTTTHCDSCKRNCHEPCDCIGSSLGRCSVFEIKLFSENICEVCGCVKSEHHQDHYYYTFEEQNIPSDNKENLLKEKNKTEKEKNEVRQKFENEKKKKNESAAIIER